VVSLDDLRAVLARNRPRHHVGSVVTLGEGWDNVAYEVDGTLIVRVSKEADVDRRARLVEREAALLVVVAGFSTLPVPVPVFADADAGVLAYAKLPGVPLSERPDVDPTGLAPVLGEFVTSLHRIPAEEVESLVERDDEPLEAWLAEAREHYRRIVDLVPARSRLAVEDFLGCTPPPRPPVVTFCHNDLGSEHVLVDIESGVTGVIDWSDAALADPVQDLARLYRDLGPGIVDLLLEHYDGARDDGYRERAAFYARCLILEDIAYGAGTGAHRYVEEGLAHLDRTFAHG
jgi:aminoglycoside phosphotransferase (APT) family kinase protein